MPETEVKPQTIKEKADAEAARAEAENPDEPAAEPVEPEPETDEDDKPVEPEPTEPSENPDAIRKGVDQAMRAFHKKLCNTFGVDEKTEGLVPSPVDGLLGFFLPGVVDPRTHPDFVR